MKTARPAVLCLLFFFPLSLPAGEVTATAGGETGRMELGSYFRIMEDKTRSLSFEDAYSAEYAERFADSKSGAPNFGYTKSAYWAKARIKNKSSEDSNFFMETVYANMHYVDLYVFPPGFPGKATAVSSGLLRPVETRDLLNQRIVFKLEIPRGAEREIYLRFQNDSSMTLTMNLWTARAFDEYLKTENLVLGFYFGILFIMILYNLFLFLSLRTYDYLYFLLFIISFALFELSYSGIGPAYIWPDWLYLNTISLHLFFTLMGIAVIRFGDSFFLTKTRAPLVYSVNRLLIALWIVLEILDLFVDYQIVAVPQDFLMLATLINVIIGALIVWSKGFYAGRFFILSWQFGIAGAVLTIMVRSGTLPSNMFTENAYHGGVLATIFLWSLSLMDRVNYLKNEAEESRKSLQRERDINTELFQKSPVFIVAVGMDNRIMMMNDTMCRSLGYRFSDMQGRDYLEALIPAGIRDAMSSTVGRMLATGKGAVFESYVKTSDGSRLLIEWHLSRVLSPDRDFDFFFGMGLDISERKRIESQLVQAQKMDTVGTLAGGLAHDFNNILGGIIGTVSLIRHDLEKNLPISPDTLLDYIGMIDDSGRRAGGIISQLLTLSRKEEFNFETTDLNESVRKVVKICRNSFDRSVDIITELHQTPALIKADAARVEQVLLNVCINACHSMTIMRGRDDRWGGHINIKSELLEYNAACGRIRPDAEEISYWMLSISDSGIGIKRADVARIFNPFFSTKKKEEGTGLGLSIVYNIIKQHHGLIDVKSDPGSGTVFNIYIPAASGEVPSPHVRAVTAGFHRGQGTVLIVDDEKIIRDTASKMLRTCGYQVLTAEDGLKGIRMFEKHRDEIRFVLLDMVMPGMSGKTVFARLKEIDGRVKVIISSGYAENQRITDTLEAGADGFLPKPYSLEELIRAVEAVL